MAEVNEYRETPFPPVQAPLDSVGALLFPTNVTQIQVPVLEGQPTTQWKLTQAPPYNLLTLDQFMSEIAILHRMTDATTDGPLPVGVRPYIVKGFKFSPATVVAHGSCFYIGNNMAVTAGHCVFKDHSAVLNPQVLGMKVVFGLTTLEVGLAATKQFPNPAKIFTVTRVMFGQDVPFGEGVVDRQDWALLKLEPSLPGVQPKWPPALNLAPLVQQVNGAWHAGHPWGIGLTVSKPPNGSGFCKIPPGYVNTVEHNIRTAPANSGCPIFDSANNVIALVASGGGNMLNSRGFTMKKEGEQYVLHPIPERNTTGSQLGVFQSLVMPNVKLFFACQLPALPAPGPGAAANTVTVRLLHGEGDDPANWQGQIICNAQPIPGNNVLQVVHHLQHAGGAVPWQCNIRAFGITLNFTAPAGGRKANLSSLAGVTPVTNMILGCLANGQAADHSKWTVLFMGNGVHTVPPAPAEERIERVPIYLEPAWKTVTAGRMGLMDTADNRL